LVGAIVRRAEEGRLIGGGVDQDVRIEEDHGSRVMALRESQVIFGRRGAAAMASAAFHAPPRFWLQTFEAH
jgi:hypothetical protein